MTFSAINDADAIHKTFSGLYDGMGGSPRGPRALVSVAGVAGRYQVRDVEFDFGELFPETGNLTEHLRDRGCSREA